MPHAIGPRLKVAIVNFESAELLRACVLSLSGIDAEIFIADNGSKSPGEATALMEIAAASPRVHLTMNDENLGFGPAVNQLAAAAEVRDDDLLWVLNPDTVVTAEAVSSLRDALAAHPRAIVSPVIMTRDGNTVWFSGGSIDTRAGVSNHYRNLPGLIERPYRVNFLTGAAIMMTGGVWRDLGGFREDLFLYWEDADLSIRATKADVNLLVVPGARIWHFVGGASSSSGAKSLVWYYYMFRNRVIVCATSRSNAIWMLAFRGALPTANHMYRAVKESGRFWPRAAAMWKGARDGYARLPR